MKTKIYCLRDLDTGEVRYIGRTIKTLEERLKQHLWDAKKKGKNSYRCTWLRKCIRENKIPTIESIYEIEGFDEGYQLEQAIIIQAKKNGLNVVNTTDGGKGIVGYRWTEERRLRCSGKNSPLYGKKRSPETLKKLADASRGKKQSELTIAKRIEKTKGINHWTTRQDFSKETRYKMRRAKLGKKHTSESRINRSIAMGGRKFRCIETGKEYRLVNEAAKELGIFQGNISSCLRKERNSTGGYRFEFIENQTKIPQRKKIKVIICNETQKTYNSRRDAANDYELSLSSIDVCLKDGTKTRKGFSFKYIK